MQQFDLIHHLPSLPEFMFMDSKTTFDQLTESEKLYAYSLYKASWEAAPIVSMQISPESYGIVKLFENMFDRYNPHIVNTQYPNMKHFLNYVAYVMCNSGNYMSHGDTKFLPRMSKDDMDKLVKDNFDEFYEEYKQFADIIFSLNDKEKTLGYPDNSTTMYFQNMTLEECKIVDLYVGFKGLEGWNTMAYKQGNTYVIHIASINTNITNVEEFMDKQFRIQYGNFNMELARMVKYLKLAQKVIADDKTKCDMFDAYIDHFTTGSLDAHKLSQRHWVKDVCPSIETNMGFIEVYRDPSGLRAEFESFVAVVDKEKTKKYKTLVDNADKFLALLPWDKKYENDVFHPPDFTALDVITFVSSGIPAGINIPNYADVRKVYGFKNVSLDNVIQLNYTSTELPKYFSEADGMLYNTYCSKSFAIDVAGHEMLGHGSGKLFVEKEDGTTNFDKSITSTWYKPRQTFGSVFGGMSSAYEECRAECVGLLLSGSYDMHKIFGYADDEWLDIHYVSWLWMIRAGVLGIVAYNPSKQNWNMAHSMARFAIYKVMVEAGVVNVVINDDNTDFMLYIDRSKIDSDGIPALKTFLTNLNVYKACANIVDATTMFNKYTLVTSDDMRIRQIYLEQRKPRREIIQPTLSMDAGGNITYKSYENNVLGAIQSRLDKMIKYQNVEK
jgi:dipeptidyl-peptidase III